MKSINPYSFVRNCWYVAGLSKEFETRQLSGHATFQVCKVFRTISCPCPHLTKVLFQTFECP